MSMILQHCKTEAAKISVLLVLFWIPICSQGGTIVRVSTSIGDFSIELLDEQAPITVQNFLNYVRRNDFNGTYFHRVIDDFVAQGGAYRFEPFVGPIDVPTDAPIVNEVNASNLRGTVAMAKLDGDPDSATNQWFVNIEDNVNLDTLNGGFTVFGKVLGSGMDIVEAIDEQPTIDLGLKASSAPYIASAYTDPSDFLYMNVEVVGRYSGAPHVYEVESGLLISSVDIDNGSDLVSMNFNSVPAAGKFIIQANLESVIPRNEPVENVASFVTDEGRLRIPRLEINDNGAVTIANNVVFVLTKSSPVEFTLESFER
ncbi:MAG: peptidylprolyl isomerase [Gammaproteobacteria bacterium]|nr:peptidylprolyl isomerase [Gammaproteobacteria bacterium]